MNRWRGCTCSVFGCEGRASRYVDPLPLCHKHGMEVARGLSESIIAEHELQQWKAAHEREERHEVDKGNREGGMVYYARIGDYIKIGFSIRLRNRLATLRVDELLAVEPGGPELERERHREFTAERIDLRRENFRPSDRLTEHIAALRQAHDLPRWAALPRTSIVTRRPKEDA